MNLFGGNDDQQNPAGGQGGDAGVGGTPQPPMGGDGQDAGLGGDAGQMPPATPPAGGDLTPPAGGDTGVGGLPPAGGEEQPGGQDPNQPPTQGV